MKNIYSVPPSKSISNRALVMAFLNSGEKIVRNVLKSDDTTVMVEAFKTLGIEHEILSGDNRSFDIRVVGVDAGRNLDIDAELFMNNAGTATRFMIPALCICSGTYVVTGNERMMQRPIGDLVEALKQLGAKIEYMNRDGYLPLKITGGMLAGSCLVKCDISSQYLSGLKIVNAFLDEPFHINIEGELVSKPYVNLTDSVISGFFMPEEFVVEGDASSASYFYALGAIDGPVTVDNVPMNTMQADIKLLSALQLMGCKVEDGTVHPAELKGVGELNCVDFPDSAMTLAVLCSIAKGKSRLTGLANLKFKECDRLAALEAELNKAGCNVTAFDDGLEIDGVSRDDLKPAQIKTYDDHRMAMCFAILKYLQSGIEILDPECVSKTYPTFWEEFPLTSFSE